MPDVRPNFSGRPAGGASARFLHEKVALKDVKKTALRLLAYLSGHGLVLTTVFLCAAATTLITIVGTRLCGYAVDHYILHRDLRGLAVLCGILAGIYLVSVVTGYLQNILMVRVAQGVSARIRRDLFLHLDSLPVRYFDTHSSGDLMSRLTNDVDNINTVLSQGMVPLFSGVVNVVGMLIAMLVQSPVLTAVVIAMTPLMFLGTNLIAKGTQPHFIAQQAEMGRMDGYVEEMVSGQKIVGLFSQEEKVEGAFSEINRRLTASSARAQAISGLMGPLNNFVNNIIYLVLTIVGSFFIIRGMFGVTVGVLFTFLLYARGFTRPINDILNLFNTVQSALAGAERVFEVLDEPPEQDPPGARPMEDRQSSVTLQDVCFSYLPDKPVLTDVSLSARPGQTVALVGPTGAGKTTIISLLTRFYAHERGEIRFNGRPIQEITTGSLRRLVSVVLQDPFLFSVTVRENIRYGRLDATDAEVEEAAKRARCHSFITRLPQGYDTVLSDNGGNLSQGQRQLLSIARAMLAQSPVLILDEATSSIDTRTELEIQSAMKTLMRGKTSFVIAHRLSTVREADCIAVIQDGQVAESGTHEELMRKNGAYAALYNSQFDDDREM